MNVTFQLRIKGKILAAQGEASDVPIEKPRGLDKLIEHMSDGALYYLDRIWFPLKGDVRTLIMDEAYKLREKIAMDFVTKLPMTSSGHDTIWVIMDRLTKSPYFLPINKDYKIDRFWQSIKEALGTRLDMSMAYHHQYDCQKFSYNKIYHSSMRSASFEALYGRMCRSSILWAEVKEGKLIGPNLVQETTEKISKIKDMLKVMRDFQKSYANKKRKHLEFSVGEYVLLKVSPSKGVVCFEKKWKLAPRFVGPFEITEWIGPVAYRL
uniref:Putative reverse transcriptase domain-containing protein n=1 Tax=Tanacetum cinerariifolium TaxID=118510 RepID=A0A6L2KQT3_TANCI|nr:putative reverse transcriptase domain-containing protein [Tanacetum cinerariifolium]